MCTDDMKKLFNQRLGRLQSAISLKPTDRIPIATGSNYFSEIYSGNTLQQIVYDPEAGLAAEVKFAEDFPEVDALRNNRIYGPLFDAVACRSYQLPGRELNPDTQFQFVEKEYMLAEDYDLLIEDPVSFLLDAWLPRLLGELSEPGSHRYAVALLKAGMAQMMLGQIRRNRVIRLQNECGMPQPAAGFFLAPYDVLADAMRGLQGVMLDMYRMPDKVKAACEVLTHEMANFALSTADPFKRYPIFVPTHKPMFLSPEQFEEFYWPSFKKVLEFLIAADQTVRIYLEGDWSQHMHHLLEMPKGKLLLDIDTQGDIHQAKEMFAGHSCVAGGVSESLLILGSPDEVFEQTKELCQTVGKGGGYIISGGCSFPYSTKPENFRAMIDAVEQFGFYDKSIEPETWPLRPGRVAVPGLEPQGMVTPWERKKNELGEITGDEALIQAPWEQLEVMAYNWLWQWVL